MPAGQWQKCPGCAAVNPVRALNGNLNICPKCDYHGRLGSSEYFALLLDDASCQLQDQEIISTDPLEFIDRKHYSDRLESTRKKSSMPDAEQDAIRS
ncbi:MAG: acetyl-CoA carboxylase carboxyl transferase subunit beta, partial [Bacteroidetes bacterium]|nr:acetyl-CoA carboxylase carboxyl transferase subunit beta [Bacteroidota bacterium]